MKRSTDRILTTHVGSLPRPADLLALIKDREEGKLADPTAFSQVERRAVADVVQKQVETGLDVVSDGEQGRANYATYIKDRLTGFEGQSDPIVNTTNDEFPEWAVFARLISAPIAARPACVGPIAWKDFAAVERDIANFQAAAATYPPAGELFMTSASPGNAARFMQNRYYPNDEAYLYALAEVMKREYKAIIDAGLILQIDCPDLAIERSGGAKGALPLEEYRRIEMGHVEALNYATEGLDPDRMRIHVCWSSTAGPHHRDVELKDIVDIIVKGRPNGISFVAANPRHEHEWKVWKDVKLPDGKILIPGVIDSTVNFVEHPELVAERITRFASVVGKENVIAGTDCGAGTFAGRVQVDTKIVWMKFQSLVDGARIASEELWGS